MPSVAINGGILSFEIIAPLIRPQTAPVSRPPSTPITIGICHLVMNTPVITAASVITVPIDRSIPPEMITNVTPKASTPFTAVASKIPMTLLNVRKLDDASEKTTNKTIKAANASTRCIASARISVRRVATVVAIETSTLRLDASP